MTAQITVPTGFVLREPADGTPAIRVLPWRPGSWQSGWAGAICEAQA
jgi:hypothetical protein